MQVPTKAQRYEWKLKRLNGMVSAVGEYTPAAFWELLDAVDYLEGEVSRLQDEVDFLSDFYRD